MESEEPFLAGNREIQGLFSGLFADELNKVNSIALPMILVTISQYVLRVAPMMMLGHLSELSLSSASVAISFSNVTGFSVIFGMAGALETLCGQAYGAEQYQRVGTFTYGAIMSLAGVFTCISFMDLHGQVIDIHWPRSFNLHGSWQVCGISHSITISLRNSSVSGSLLADSKCDPPNVLELFCNSMLPFASLLGFHIQVKSWKCRGSTFDWCSILLKLMVCMRTTSLHYHVPYSFGAAASTRISNELGAGKPQATRVALYVVLVISIAEFVTTSAVIFGCRYILGYAFSDEKEVADYIKEISPFLCLSIILDSIEAVLSGVARGSGWQHIGAYANLGAFYLVGIPVALLLGFAYRLNGKGLWIGLVAGATVQSFLYSLATALTDWEKLATEARRRILEGTVPAGNDLEWLVHWKAETLSARAYGAEQYGQVGTSLMFKQRQCMNSELGSTGSSSCSVHCADSLLYKLAKTINGAAETSFPSWIRQRCSALWSLRLPSEIKIFDVDAVVKKRTGRIGVEARLGRICDRVS
ncbi:hypothetical protein DH2020_037770 [Rehmannia glutinosa]|uniref:Protein DETOXIFICATION n=1 Tax=Rehmannia glutinosa TaxID=99300 RepID=A0ABR0V384_REHGL